MSEHARLSPSAASRWMRCGGSVEYIPSGTQIPSDPETSEFGTRCHELASLWLSTGNEPEALTDEEREAVEPYVTYCMGIAGSIGFVEQRVVYSEDIWGTADFWVLDREGFLNVVDLKTGLGYVEEFENWQLIIYALAIISTHSLAPRGVRLTIVQPRAFIGEAIRSWEISTDILAAYRFSLDLPLGSTLTPGSHCHYCPARHRCAALYNSAAILLEVAMLPIADSSDEEQIGRKLAEVSDAMKRLKMLEDGLRNMAEALPEPPRGWKWVAKRSNRIWKIPVEFLRDLGKTHGVDLFVEKPLTPAQAEKLIDKELIADLTTRPDNGRTLERMKPQSGRKAFEK